MLLGVLNVVTGVFVQRASSVAKEDSKLECEHELEGTKQLVDDIKDFLSPLEHKDTHTILQKDLERYLEDDTVREQFGRLGFEAHEVKTFFALLDTPCEGRSRLTNAFTGASN